MEHALDPPLMVTTGAVDDREAPRAHPVRREGFAALYEAEYEAMIRLAFLLLGSQEQAEDVVHDALARLVERWDRVQNHGGYLRSSVVNGARSALRRRRLMLSHPVTDLRATDPEADYLADLLEVLRPNQRAVVVLRYFEQLTIPEIARTLGLREGTVKSSLHRSLRTLRQEIQP